MEVILALVAFGTALVSLAFAYFSHVRLGVLSERLADAEHRLSLARVGEPEVRALAAPKPLEGLRIVLHITQDHPHAVFVPLLKEQLLREDVGEVFVQAASKGDNCLEAWRAHLGPGDIFIDGSLTCNGYADVYFQAEFTCYFQDETVCILGEKPPGGDRPGNLALELVAKLSTKYERLKSRNERRKAIDELRGPS